MKAHCPRCDAALGALDQFCGFCGTRVARPCPRCQHPVQAGRNFCAWCGAGVGRMDVGAPLKPEEIESLHKQRTEEHISAAEEHLVKELGKARRTKKWRELGELLLLLVGLALLLSFGLEVVEVPLNRLLRDSPAKVLTLGMGLTVALILLIAMLVETRRAMLRERIQELEERLQLVRQRRPGGDSPK